MASLEALHRSNDCGVVLIGNAHADEVAADLKPPMQDHHFLTARSGLHGDGRHGRPTALRDDGLVALDCRLGGRDVAHR